MFSAASSASAASLWNRLSEELKDCSTLMSFENKLIEVCNCNGQSLGIP